MRERENIPEGWEVEVEERGRRINYKYTELATGETIEGMTSTDYLLSPASDIQEFIEDRELMVNLEKDGVTPEQIVRKILNMIGILHTQGYESLYIDPYMSASGMGWRYHIGVTLRRQWPHKEFGIAMMEKGGPAGSIGGGYDQKIPWCRAGNTLEEYVESFINAYPRLLRQATEPNSEYVHWYREMLEQTGPQGVLIFSHLMGDSYEYASTWGEPKGFKMRMPPGYTPDPEGFI